jgi:glucose uptake protein GlcU
MIDTIIGLGILALLAITLLVVSYSAKNEKDNDGRNTFIFGMFILSLSMIAIGVIIGANEIKRSKYKVTPVVKVECMNSKCDTTYVYSFKDGK